MSKDFNHIKDWLMPLIDERQVKVEDVAKKANLSRATIYAWFTDRNRPDDQTMAAVCKALSEIPLMENGKLILKKVPLVEALAQYTARVQGRPSGTTGIPRSVTARTR